MKTWAAMYGIIWLAFLEIVLVLFLPFGYTINVVLHIVIAVAMLGLAFFIYRNVQATSCPDRIKRITKTTWNLSILQAVLGLALMLGIALQWGDTYTTVVSFLHVANALAIITQASSSATAFDMWEEKEFAAEAPKM